MLTPVVITRLANRLPLDGLAWDDSSAPQAAVLVALTDEEQPRVILGRRAAHLQHHPGEVAFPGGKREPEDASPWVTARREAHEEVGITQEHVHPLGELSPLMTRTGFEVLPCVAMVSPRTGASAHGARVASHSAFVVISLAKNPGGLLRHRRLLVLGIERWLPSRIRIQALRVVRSRGSRNLRRNLRTARSRRCRSRSSRRWSATAVPVR